MISTRTRLIAATVAIAAVSSAASAQTYSFSRTELGRIVPTRFATSTQQLLANVDIARTMPSVADEADTRTDAHALIREAAPAENWSVIALHESDDADENGEESSNSGFFSSTAGRASMFGFAGLAGATYFVLRPSDAKAAEEALIYTLGRDPAPNSANLPGVIAANLPDAVTFAANPEPATFALMGLGLGALGLVARRRARSNSCGIYADGNGNRA